VRDSAVGRSNSVDGQPSLTPQPQPINRPRFWFTIRALLRARIVAGLLTVIPIYVTYVTVRFVFDLIFGQMKSTTEPLAKKLTQMAGQGPSPVISWVVGHYETWIVPIVAVLLTLFLLYVLGMFTANVFGRRIIASLENLFSRLPLVKTVYKSIKQIVEAIGGFQSMHFQRVVLIEFPAPGYKRVAFLTSVMTDRDTGRKIASIFIPYTPYLTTGYMQLVALEDVSETNWSVEEAVKWVMSGGIIHPASLPFDEVSPVRWEEGSARGTPAEGGSAAKPSQRPSAKRNDKRR
jgi:uncharacterized membrane protein